MFLAVGGDPKRHDQAVFPDVDAIQHEPDQIQAVERLRLPGFQLRARLGDESSAHGALARAAGRHRRGQRLETARVLTRCHPDEHLLDHPTIQRILAGHELEGRQRHFAAVAADPWPANRHLAATEHDLARHRAGA